MAKVIDCTSSPSIDALRNAGITGVIRYLTWQYYWAGTNHNFYNPKLIVPSEYDTLTANGFDVVLNWEFDAEDWLSGATGGTAHAVEAVRQAQALGYPQGSAIYFSCDFNMTLQQWSASGKPYASAASSIVRASNFRMGVYGPYDVLTWCQDAGLTDCFWQAGMSTSWSGGRNASTWPNAHLRQIYQQSIGGIDCDVNEVLQEDYGQVNTMASREEANTDTYLWQMARGQDPITGIVGADGKVITPGVPNLPWQRLLSIESKVDALTTAVTSIAAQAFTDTQITALATALASKLPPEMTPADVEAAVRTVLHNA